jgi:two-component system sensor histidine kinase KdpD
LRLRFLLRAAALSFAVSDVQYLLTFGIMLAVGLITGQLTAGLRFQARVASHREERAAALYEIARDLSGAVQIEQVVKISDESIERTFRASAALLLLPNRRDSLAVTSSAPNYRLKWTLALRSGRLTRAAGGFGTDTLPGSEVLYVPLRAPIARAACPGGEGAQSPAAAHSGAAAAAWTPSPR